MNFLLTTSPWKRCPRFIKRLLIVCSSSCWSLISRLIIGKEISILLLTLSRNVPTESGEPDLAVEKFISSMSDESGLIFLAQKNDPLISESRQFLAKNVFSAKANPGYKQKSVLPKIFFVERNLLWVNLNRQGGLMRSILFCPDSLKKIVLEAAHCSPMSGHSGKQKTIDRVELGYWWPGLTYDVANFLLACHRCREITGAKPAPSPLRPLPALSEPGLPVHMDMFGPLKTRSASGQKYIMVMTDAFSKYTELAAIPDKTAVSFARAFFKHWICRHGVPQLIVLTGAGSF